MENNTAEIVRDVTLKSTEHKKILIEDIKDNIIFMPKNFEQLDLDNFLDVPRKLKETIKVEKVESFIEYINKFKNENSIIKGFSPNNELFECIIDYHSKTTPDWCKHTVLMGSVNTDEWNCWLRRHKERMTQRNFLHFIEDNAEQIASPDLAEITKHIKDVDVKSYNNAQHKVDTTSQSADTQKAVNIESGLPDKIELAISPWRYSPLYKVEARIYLHIDDDGVYFSYGLINHDRVLQHIFDAYAEQIKTGTELEIFI